MAETFDWKALGLTPLYDGAKDRTDSSDYEQGTLAGYYSQPDAEGMINQYDVDGKFIQRYKKNETGLVPILKQVASSPATKIMLMAAAGGLLNGFGSAAGSGELATGGFLGEAPWAATPGASALEFGASGIAPGVQAAGDAILSTPMTSTAVGTEGSTLGTLTGSGYVPAAGGGGLISTAGGSLGGAGALGAGALGAGSQGAGYDGITGALNPIINGTPNGNPNASSFLKDLFGDEFGGMLDSAGSWLTGTNLGKMLTGAIGGMYTADQAKEMLELRNKGAVDVANIGAQNNLDQIAAKDKNTIEANQRYSNSVTGLRPGLINSTPSLPLKRAGGTNVFGANGLIGRRV